MKRFLSILLVAALLITALPMATSSAASQYATVVGGWLRLRTQPNFNAETIQSYYTGTQVEILSTSGEWYRVKTPDSKTGYMYNKYLSFSASAITPADGTAVVTSHNGYGVRLRTGPGTGYRIIRTYAVGTTASVLQRGSSWSKISIGGTVGYMMNQFLNFGGSSDSGNTGGGTTSDVYGYATIWSRNGYGVRLRTGPGTGYGKIGVYSVGTRVTIHQYGNTWCYITVGSRTGYMMTEFLKIERSNTITGVTLSTTTPIVQDTLKATVSPSGAKATFTWFVDGVAIAVADDELWLGDQSYADKVITVTATGTDGYSGAASASTQPVLASRLSIDSVTLNNHSPAVGDTLTIGSISPATATYTCAWFVDGTQVSTGTTFKVTKKHAEDNATIELRVTGTGLYESTASDSAYASEAGILSGVTIVNTTTGESDPNEVNAGHVLRADVEPATTLVSYRWYRVDANNNEVVIGKSRTLTVTAAMKDYTLKVVATGTGSYKDSTADSAEISVTDLSRITKLTLSPLTGLSYNAKTSTGTKLTASVSATASVKEPASFYTFEWLRGDDVIAGEAGNTYTLTEEDIGELITVRVSANDPEWTTEVYEKTTSDTVKSTLYNVSIVDMNGAAPTSLVPGTEVTVQVDPASALSGDHVSVTWYVNNTLRQISNTYTIKEGDAGASINTLKAVVTGMDPYTGTITRTANIPVSNTVPVTQVNGSTKGEDDPTTLALEQPSEPVESTDPEAPAESTDPNAPVESTEPVESTDPEAPVESTEPVESTDPEAPVESTEPVEATESETPVESTEPVESPEPETPVESGTTEDSNELGNDYSFQVIEPEPTILPTAKLRQQNLQLTVTLEPYANATYRWLRNQVEIFGWVEAYYDLTDEDWDQEITVEITLEDGTLLQQFIYPVKPEPQELVPYDASMMEGDNVYVP